MVRPGHFMLHSIFKPAFPAGDYVLEGTHTISKGSATQQYEGNVRITAPRFRLPPDQVLSTFPPAQEVGSFDARLPQIVMKRRTLPWERAASPSSSDGDLPWLALVVIAEGEGQISGETNIADCVTDGVTLDGPNDVATGIYLEVTQGIVNAVFPRKDEIGLLAHVREVDVNDTELAEGDDDGFVSVVLSNRLPEFDRANNRPVKYFACLVNLEGQLDVLPVQTRVTDTFNFFSMNAVGAQVVSVADAAASTNNGPSGRSGATNPSSAAASPSRGVGSALKALDADIGEDFPVKTSDFSSVTVAADEEVRLARDIINRDFRDVIPSTAQNLLRFPVLAHWSFTAGGPGSFESYMGNLDIGLLGTVVPPEPDDTSAPPEVAETGHLGLDHQTRRGDQVRAWYRSPLAPHATKRAFPGAAEDDPPVLAHTADQLRVVLPDGRENLSLASAFEIGRLMALSQPDLVAALMRWRREQFGLRRSQSLAADLTTVLSDRLDDGVLEAATLGDLGAVLGNTLAGRIADDAEPWVGKTRSPVDPGLDIPFLTGSIDQIVVDGFELPDALLSAKTTGVVVSQLSKLPPTRDQILKPGPLSGQSSSKPGPFGKETDSEIDAALGAKVDQLATVVLEAAEQPGKLPDDLIDALGSISNGRLTGDSTPKKDDPKKDTDAVIDLRPQRGGSR